MIHFLTNTGWSELKSNNNSIKTLKEYAGADSIKGVEKLAEYLGFGFDIYVFIDPVLEDHTGEKVLMYFTNKEKAESEFHRLVDSL